MSFARAAAAAGRQSIYVASADRNSKIKQEFSPSTAMGRAPCCDKASVKKGPWSPEEDAKLKSYINEHGTGGNWIALPQKIGLKRCGKSCRLRWLNYLRPNIKHGDFSEQEEHIICSLYISIGSRWSIIAAQLPGRTDNDIKNYWNTKLKKKLLGKRPSSRRLSAVNPSPSFPAGCVTPIIPNSVATGVPPQLLSPTALERIQLHMKLSSSMFAASSAPVLPARAEVPAVDGTTAGLHQEYHSTAFSADAGSGTDQLPSQYLDYADLGLHDELHALLYSKSGVQDDQFSLPEFNCSSSGDLSGSINWPDHRQEADGAAAALGNKRSSTSACAATSWSTIAAASGLQDYYAVLQAGHNPLNDP